MLRLLGLQALLFGEFQQGEGKRKTIVMEAMCDPFLYIWYFNLVRLAP